MADKVKFHDVQLFSFNDEGNANKQHLSVKGYAIHTGRFHGIIEIPESEIQNAANTLNGRKIFKNHEYDTDDVLGKILSTNAELDPYNSKMAVTYNGYIDKNEEKIIYKVENGLLDSTSIGFEFEPECGICGKPLKECHHFIWDEGFYIIARNVNVLELSVVGIPADKDATVEAMAFSKNKFMEDLENQFSYKFKAHKGDVPLNQNTLTKEQIFVGDILEDKIDLKEEINKMLKEAFEKENIKSDKMAEENKKILELQEKLTTANDKITELTEAHDNKVSQLKTDFETEKNEAVESLQDQIVEEKGKAIEAQNALEALQEEIDGYKETISNYEDKLAEIDQARLSDKKAELLALHKELTKEEEFDGLDEMDETFIDKQITMLQKIKENQGVVKRFTNKQVHNPFKQQAQPPEDGEEALSLEEFIGSKFKK